MTKLVVVSDLHLDKETLGVPRFAEVERAVWQAANYAMEARADAFVCLGDITDPDSRGATLRAIWLMQQVAIALSKDEVPSLWIAGNHDVEEDGTGATTLTPMMAIDWFSGTGVVVIEHPKLVRVGMDVDVACLPYAPVARAYDPVVEVERMMSGTKAKVVVAGHLMIHGVVLGEETEDMSRGREVLFPVEQTKRAHFRMNGHYHTRQDFDPGDGGPPIHIPGSPCAFAFGEHATGRPSFSVIEL